MKKSYKTVIISDTHIGKPNAQLHHLVNFLSGIEMEKLIINGDFVDFRQLNLLGKRGPKETYFMNYIIGLVESGVSLIYVKGNHDSFVKHFHNIKMNNMHIVNELTHTTVDNKKYFIFHGEKFDFICHHLPFFAKLTNLLYSLLYFLEKVFNKKLEIPGYISLSEKVKHFLKKTFFPRHGLHKKCSKLAKKHDCDGLIFGHYHFPFFKTIDGIDCINCGDRVCSCTAIVEHLNGKLELIYYT